MPARRRPKPPPPPELDPLSRFGTILRESAEREQAERERVRRQRQEAEEAAVLAAARAAELVEAQRELERAIVAARVARARRRGVAEADGVWRSAKARLVELETGSAPAWNATAELPTTDDASDADEP